MVIGTNMWLIVVRPHGLIDRIVVIASVQAQVLWLFLCGRRTCNHQVVQGCLGQCAYHCGWHQQRSRPEACLVHHSGLLRFVPCLPRSVGLAPVAAPAKGADAASPHPYFAIPRQCLPVRHIPAIPLAKCAQTRLAARHPPKAIIDRCAGSQFPWQGIPLDTGAQHIQDSRQHLPVIFGRSSSCADELDAPGSTGARAPRPHRSVPMVSFVSLAFFSVSFPFIVSHVSE
jgi:hypothetical protein